MEKTITWDDLEIKVSNNVTWLMIYRDQFGHDIVPALIPLLNAGIDLVFGAYQATDGMKDIKKFWEMDTESIKDAIIEASGIESVEILNIIWAMAKAADGSISEPMRWYRQFDSFPLDIIVPDVFEMIYKHFISTKNLNRLQTMLGDLKPSTSTES